MGKSWLSAVFAVSIAVTIIGCGKSTTAPTSGATAKTTEQVLKDNPDFKKSIIDSRIAQVEGSNLPPAEKQRIIAQLRAEGPPNSK